VLAQQAGPGGASVCNEQQGGDLLTNTELDDPPNHAIAIIQVK
jgi:hypothetical protein